MEDMVLVEIGVSSVRRIRFDEEQNEESTNASLDLLEENRDDSHVKLTIYWKRKVRYFNSKFCKKNFKVGNLVLKKVFVAHKEMSSNSLGKK